MNWSEFGKKLTSRSGILELMDDLGKAMQSGGEKYMLGGGNPGSIPELNRVWRRRMQEILSNGDEFERGIGNYDTPQGKGSYLQNIADMLRSEYGWNLGPENIAVTNGSQSAFFMLFNLLSGELDSSRGEGAGTIPHSRKEEKPRQAPGSGSSLTDSNGRAVRQILLPLMPEYIGYADQGIGHEHFRAYKPDIELIDEHYFKYHVDFDSIVLGPNDAAICVSRPTNPTGNVLSDEEVRRLDQLAREHDVPLLLDNAYGTPFPNMIFTQARPIWNENIVLGMSLSKIGLPSTRTGIIIAREEIVQAISAVNAIMSLANNTLGQMITGPLIESGEILRLSNEVVRPFYRDKSLKAQDAVLKHMQGLPCRIHLSEGALFLWLWFDHPDIDTAILYERLKERQVIIVPGKYFFYGIDEDWEHRNQCIRINFAQSDDVVDEGIRRIALEVREMIGA